MANEIPEPAETHLGELASSFEQVDKRLFRIEVRLAWLLGIVVASTVLRVVMQLTGP